MEKIRVNYLGQCGFTFETESVSFAIDPVLNDIIEDGTDFRCYPPVFPPEELSVDYIFCTHDHIDHLADETVARVSKAFPDTKFIVPKGCVKYVENLGISAERIVGVTAKEPVSLMGGKLIVNSISAAHPDHHVDENGLDHNLCYEIQYEGRRIVHLGDTYLTEQLENDLKELGTIDVMFVPINGMDEEKAARGLIGNLNTDEAAYLSDKLGVKCAVPTHFDMILGNTEDPEKFVSALKLLNANAEYWVPEFGNVFIF